MKNKNLFLVALTLILFSSCKLFQPSVMLRTGRDYNYDQISDSTSALYKISPNDIVEFSLYANNGFRLVDLTMLQNQGNSGGNNNLRMMNQQRNMLSFTVEYDGTVKLPVVGRKKLAGYTLREAELYLQDLYREYYNDPYVLLNVNNKRVIVFPGAEGQAQVVPLINDNTTLLEALASTGGISKSGKAYRVKLIRGPADNPQVFLIDLSTIEGIKQGNMVLQSNDIIYVEPVFRVTSEVLAELSPIIGLISSMVTIVGFFTILKTQ